MENENDLLELENEDSALNSHLSLGDSSEATAGRRSSNRSIKRKRFDDELVEYTNIKSGRATGKTQSYSTDFAPISIPSTSTSIPVPMAIAGPSTSTEPPPLTDLTPRSIPNSSKNKKKGHLTTKDLGRWKPVDDLALIIGIEQTNDIDIICAGVKFSCKFTKKEITARWFALLYDHAVSRVAVQNIRNLHPEVFAAVQRKALWSEEEDKILGTIKSVPYEILNKKFRMAQKTLDREVSHVQQSVAEVEKCLSGKEVKASEITHLLGGVEEKLQILKRKAEESIAEEMNASNVCKRRLEHLKDHSTLTGGTLTNWRRKRLDRMVIEYFLRNGFYQSALLLAERSEMKEFTNIDIFLNLREVEKSLSDHETQKCLLWCHDNRSKLRKLKSTMEFNLRVQEFIELIRKDRRIDAIKHSRKHFPGFEEEHLATIQKAMALLAYPTDVDIVRYASLFDIRRWDDLIKQFRQENYRLFQLASQSAFTVSLEIGLSALKTPQCYTEHNATKNPACPVCNEDLNNLAEPLPFAHCSQSRLYCHITGLPMNENNPPMMLPNGYIYGEQGLTQMAKENKGQVKCPKTKEVFPFKKVEKVFVM